MSFCSSWLPAWRAAVSSVISQKWEMQLKWQVAASSCYDKWAETCRVTDSGTSTAAESLSLERTRSTSGGLNSVYPRLGTPFPRHFICKSTENFDLWNNEASRRSAKCLWSWPGVSCWSNTEVGADLGPLLSAALFSFHEHPNWCEFVAGSLTCFHISSSWKHLEMSNSLK